MTADLYHETAYAKINLALHVRRRRADGYHELETVFAFVDAGDELVATPAEADRLEVVGEFSSALEGDGDNIVTRALSLLPHGKGWHVRLDKRLPVAAGLGGGSADAGAIFRLVERVNGLPSDWEVHAAGLGADVPACVASRALVGRGTGTDLAEVDNDLAGTPVLLVNPRVALPTGPVFRGWDQVDRGPMPEGDLRTIALTGRNDLEAPAVALVPVIAQVLEKLSRSGAWLSRMSGSGATCFALFDDVMARDAAAASLPPEWWRLAGKLI
ncbi:4-diphosphocytidyl-2-C-methyl-D-erythritol kinase [Novosphingobium nitrogenifigens DSM 19370]|uniref:4-diphosphocytidyl-2-C-methyl-D-erythritol kinase n=1 Tax=Novosphingobium nitrogenifigens DSM 19370 TaxID=983920 RepID=F1ZA78_9SPHN|nr:4-(cytidine 5'-diphospho)-2-C-methyl-D-erythritol kinase [Novosphingobium nitrogenifigens]EGD58514.1 4-diphosphocytidyl-2-C-methyl-D-erythritol kinase [Novosphingobium nitrogenifigens DSM 19370]